MGFPSHPREWFSLNVYHHLFYTGFQPKPDGINVNLLESQRCHDGGPPFENLFYDQVVSHRGNIQNSTGDLSCL